jgi:hypothetical protein
MAKQTKEKGFETAFRHETTQARLDSCVDGE